MASCKQGVILCRIYGWLVDELEARALLCRLLPDLREGAEAGRWTARLEEIIAEVRVGGSAAQALSILSLENSFSDYGDDAAERGPGPFILWGEPSAEVRGDYVCPGVSRCGRRDSRDAEGRPPVCEITGVLMTFKQT